ncbi:acyltransferase family protein [Flagellimonas sp.]|uniref:acyltransferase family protein n=1 Tax=Flagellimonas sp. TaxID=2058762 RepID=UPI003B50C824
MSENLSQPKRILSIDALRGFDMLLIIFADHFFYNLNKGAGTPFTEALAKQFSHPEWFGSTFYDIIMPLFLFVVGAVIPFSLSKRMQENVGKGAIYRKLAKRFIILFILGWIVQGNLLAWDIDQFHVFSNTLQAIAVGYLFSCIAYIHLKRKWLYVVFALCLVVYALLLTIPNVPGVGRSVLLPDQNFALYFDRLILGKYDDGLQYTWLLSGFGFIATTLSGVFAGELIKSNLPRKKVSLYLLLAGIAALVLGLIWGIWHPIVKKIWSSTFVLASSGVCYILLALFYWIIDVKGKSKWAFPLKVIGMNAITAYVLSHIINFREIAGFLLFGLEQYVEEYYPMLLSLGGFGILYLLLWYMYKKGTFIKV